MRFTDKNALAKTTCVSNESETDKNDASQNATGELEAVAGPSRPTPMIENLNEYKWNDDSDDDALIDRNDSLPIVEDVNEYAFDSDSEYETANANESQTLAERYFGKNSGNPALTYMLEHSSLTQNQIIRLIEHNNKVNKNIKTPEKDAPPESTKDNEGRVADVEPTSGFLENSNEVGESKLRSAGGIDDDSATIEIVPSSPESDDFVEVEPLRSAETSKISVTSNISSSDNGKVSEKLCSSSTAPTDDVTRTVSLDSDSDDFIEVQDIPIFDTSISERIERRKEENIQIAFKPGEEPEDDIFADIFEKTDGIKIQSPERVQSAGNLKGDVLPTVPKEPIEAEEEEVKAGESQRDASSVRNVSKAEAETRGSQNSNNQMQQNDTDVPADVNLEEDTREKPVILPTSERDLMELQVH